MGDHTHTFHPVGEMNAPALSDGDDVALLDEEGRRAVRGEGLVALLVAAVLGDVAEVVAAEDNGAVHLGGDDDALEDAAADADIAGEGALLVDVGALREQQRKRGERRQRAARRECEE